MAEVSDVGRMLEMAERAAMQGDLPAAEELLRNAAAVQEAALGPLHPDLANTLNNLGIVAEKLERPGDAEALYRRAVAITTASLAADHPMVAASRQNLEDFCRARGLPIDPHPAPAILPRTTAVEPAAFVSEHTPAPSPVPAAYAAASPAASRSELPPAAPGGSSVGRIAIAAVVLVIAALLVWRPWSSREPAATPATAAVAPPAAAPVQTERRAASPAASVPIEAPPQPAAAAPTERPAASVKPSAPAPAPAPAAGAVTLATAELCQTFSTSDGRWRCDPATDPLSAGPIVLYTRVKSPRDAEIVHRWYRGDALRQSVKLPIRANATEGYRTYTRQTVDSGSDWRVEVRRADGELLHEQRFAVR